MLLPVPHAPLLDRLHDSSGFRLHSRNSSACNGLLICHHDRMSQLGSCEIGMLLDMLLHFLLKCDFIPIVVERHHGVDRVGELRNQKQTKDRVKDLFVRRVYCPIAIEDGVTMLQGLCQC